MRIAQLGPLWKQIPPVKYGGSESVVSDLTEALVEKGQDVTLFACGGSKTKAKLVEVIDRPMYDLMGGFVWTAIPPYEFLTYYELFNRLQEFDVIHNHLGLHPLVFEPLVNIPIVTTIHSSLSPDFPFFVDRLTNSPIVSISDAQRKMAPGLNYVDTIYHGIQTSLYDPSYTPNKSYFLFLSALTDNKGIDIAVKACAELNENLIIAGIVEPDAEEFFNKNVKPYIDGKKIQFVGEVGLKEKVELYRNAKALLFPIRWNEAFGLVMVESLACGTPVIGYRNGSVPEVVEDGKTGFVVDNFEDFKMSMKKINSISREDCRKQAVGRFNAAIMAENYIKVYEKLIAS